MDDEAPWRRALRDAFDEAEAGRGARQSGPRFEAPAFGAVREPTPESSASRPPNRHVAAIVVIALVVALIAGGAGALFVSSRSEDSSNVEVDTAAPRSRLSTIVERARPGVVAITATIPRGTTSATSTGTGILVTADGEVVTNAHVVRNATAIRVAVKGRPAALDADLVAADPGADLALIRIRDTSGLPTAVLGRSANLRVGDEVIAIGNALGLEGDLTVTRGIVSAIDRSVDTEAGRLTGLVQTDAAISSGNSGGALLDRRGNVIGVNTAVLSSRAGNTVEGIGFAIPIDTVKKSLVVLRSG